VVRIPPIKTSVEFTVRLRSAMTELLAPTTVGEAVGSVPL
jgi:hypothetical protein